MGRKKIDSFDMSCWMRALLILWITKKTNKSVQEKIKSEILLRGKNDKTKAAVLQAHHEKTGFLGKDNNARKNRKH